MHVKASTYNLPACCCVTLKDWIHQFIKACFRRVFLRSTVVCHPGMVGWDTQTEPLLYNLEFIWVKIELDAETLNTALVHVVQ